ncbi:hypothetical protein [Vibrio owensii]|uniref:hypothetical protein n=1 Tax=Vibrio owensii TaxID=696485 RepID=UPI0018F1F8EC|nr:hypothetical protein [Vibrio owensii]
MIAKKCTILKTHSHSVGKTSVGIPEHLSEHSKDVIKHAVHSFGFLLERGETTFGEFVEVMKSNSDTRNPQIAETIRVFESTM